MARPNQGPRGQQGQPAQDLYQGNRAQWLRTLVSVIAGELGVAVATVLPPQLEASMLAILGGDDGKLSAREIRYLSLVPELVFKNQLTDRAVKEFSESFMQTLRDYDANPNPDRDKRREEMKNIVLGVLKKSKETSPDVAAKKMNFFEAMKKLPDNDYKLVFQLLLIFEDQDVTQIRDLEHHGQKKTVTYTEFVKLGREREVSPDDLHVSIGMIKAGKATPALGEWFRVLTNAPLLNPPKAPEKPSFAKQFFDDVTNEARDLLKPTQPGEPLGEPFATMQAKVHKWQ